MTKKILCPLFSHVPSHGSLQHRRGIHPLFFHFFFSKRIFYVYFSPYPGTRHLPYTKKTWNTNFLFDDSRPISCCFLLAYLVTVHPTAFCGFLFLGFCDIMLRCSMYNEHHTMLHFYETKINKCRSSNQNNSTLLTI